MGKKPTPARPRRQRRTTTQNHQYQGETSGSRFPRSLRIRIALPRHLSAAMRRAWRANDPNATDDNIDNVWEALQKFDLARDDEGSDGQHD